MMTISPTKAHKNLVTEHQTMKWQSQYGSVSIRKTAGCFIVTLDDYENQKVTKASYATLKGALVAAETLRAYSL